MVSASHQASVPIATTYSAVKMRSLVGRSADSDHRGAVSSTYHAAPVDTPRDIDDLVPELIALRRDLHAHPELAFEERRTAGIVAAELRRLDLEVHEGLAGTGIVGTLRQGRSKRTIGLRADMDALPITEQSRFVACQSACRCASRLRSRRPYRDAARCRTPSGAHAPFRRNRAISSFSPPKKAAAARA